MTVVLADPGGFAVDWNWQRHLTVWALAGRPYEPRFDSKVLEHESATFGFNAQTEEYVDMVKAGVIDPTKVVRTALQDAASVAGLMITTEAAIAEAPKKGDGAPQPQGGGMGDMGF